MPSSLPHPNPLPEGERMKHLSQRSPGGRDSARVRSCGLMREWDSMDYAVLEANTEVTARRGLMSFAQGLGCAGAIG
jgi:hypothetical protein